MMWIEFIISGIIVILVGALVFSAVFLIAINNGAIKVTPEVEEILNKLPFWNTKNEIIKKKKN